MSEASKPTISPRKGQIRQRGKCPVCNYSVTIRRNGYAERHYLYASEKYACPGGEDHRSDGDVPSVPLAWWFKERERGL